VIIWTDCDREGEHIGGEIRDAAKRGNGNIQVKRARFSNVERTHILRAARQLVALDDKQVDAVAARIELDLRTGYAFTRFLTNNLTTLGGPMADLVLSYGELPLLHASSPWPISLTPQVRANSLPSDL